MKLSDEMFRDEIAEAKKNLIDLLDAYCDKWEVNIFYRLPNDGDTNTDLRRSLIGTATNSKHERKPK